jgi:hypothetical protein
MKPFPITGIVILLTTAIGLAVGNHYWFPADFLSKAYDKLQTPLFTGFLTLGSFLLSLKTFIVVQLKKELFDHKEYRDHFDAVQENQTTDGLYAPLKQLGNFLLWSELFALLTSLSQITIGFVPHSFAKIWCLSAAIATLAVVIRAWLAIRKALNQWFTHLK